MTRCSVFIAGVLAGLLPVLVMPVSFALAQIPLPATVDPARQSPEAPSAPPSVTGRATIPDFDSGASVEGGGHIFVNPQGILTNAITGEPVMTPQQAQQMQQQYEKLREDEKALGGFVWTSWDAAGKTIHDFVYKRDPSLKVQMDGGLDAYTDIAVYDIDRDGMMDVITWQHSGCGAEGNSCLFTIYWGAPAKGKDQFVGKTMRPYEDGIMLDQDGYYAF